MRIALTTTAALALPLHLADSHGRLERRRERIQKRFQKRSDIFANENRLEKERPLWKQMNHRVVEWEDHSVEMTECDPMEPDVGILACATGYSCVVDESSSMGGLCFSDDLESQRDLSPINATDYCAYYAARYYDCNCSNWNKKKNVGTFACTKDLGFVTNRGVNASYSFTITTNATKTGGPQYQSTTTCFDAVSPNHNFSNYCFTDSYVYPFPASYYSFNETCSVIVNDKACKSCTVGYCNATYSSYIYNASNLGAYTYPLSFDCTNVNQALQVDLCSKGTLWKSLFAGEFPTTEPTIYPTWSPTIATAEPSVMQMPSMQAPSAVTAPTGTLPTGSSPTGSTSETLGSDAWSQNLVVPLVVCGLALGRLLN